MDEKQTPKEGSLLKEEDNATAKTEKEYKVKKWSLHEMGRLVFCLWQVHQ